MLRLSNNNRFVSKKYMSTLLKHVKRDPSREKFLSVFPEVLENLVNSSVYSNAPTFLSHYAKVLEYNVLKEKRFRPSILLDAYKTLERPENINEENTHLANILAWCIELLHTSIIINDDFMDRSETRGNEQPWYRKKSVGLNATNDAMLVLEGAFVLLKNYFSNHSKYMQLLNLLHYTNMTAAVGQSLDWQCNATGQPIYELFSVNSYKTTIRYKGCVPFVESPFRAALILSNNSNESTLREIIDVVIKLGEAFQIDNDILDVYDNGKVRNQIGSDISEGKCTWLAIQVLEHGSKELQKTFKDNYGRPGDKFEKEIIRVYAAMDLFGKYLTYKEQTLNFINDRTKLMTKPSLKRATLNLVQNIFP